MWLIKLLVLILGTNLINKLGCYVFERRNKQADF